MTTAREHIAFSAAVKKIQRRKGSRSQYAKIIERSPLRSTISAELAEFIAGLRSVYLATSGLDGQPYVQHRGGPPGFLTVVDEKTISFPDFRGNRQFVSQGNLSENPKAFLFLMDYRNRARVKVWGTAEVREDQPDALATAMRGLGDYRAAPEQLIRFRVDAWEANCRQHIPVRYDEEEVQALLEERDARIRSLEKQLQKHGRQ